MKESFSYAFSGLAAGIKSERNLRIHIAAAFYALLAAAVTDVSRAEWCVVVLCCGVVIAAELMNTAVEKLCDEINPEHSPKIGLVKDMAAGAVLVFALASAVTGIIIFINLEKISNALDFAKNNLIFAAMIIATIPVSAYLVFRKY